MKKISSYLLPLFALLMMLSSCQQEEYPSPTKTEGLIIDLRYPETTSDYDSAYILFKNATTEIKQKLTLNNSSYTATGRVANLPSGVWAISTVYLKTVVKNHKSFETNGTVDMLITETATHLISDETGVYIKGTDLIRKFFTWTDYYYYFLYADSETDKSEGFVRLPEDPTNPFIEISTYDPKWNYAYADRSFFNTSLDGTSSYYQGGGAFEIYGDIRDVIDTTSLEPGISGVRSKAWNDVDCLVLVYSDYEGDELLLYHQWD